MLIARQLYAESLKKFVVQFVLPQIYNNGVRAKPH